MAKPKKTAAQREAEERTKAAAAAASQSNANRARAAKPAAKPAAPAGPAAAPAGPAAPAAPARVDPFFTADDLNAINAFTTDLASKMQAIDTGLTNLETDTTFQKTKTDDSAKTATSGATDDAIARGVFSSSIKDAVVYDIEAQRSLSEKFLDDKLTTARLDAGTNKKILADAKTNFDTAMAAKQKENATGVNDSNSSAWAAAMAAWNEANPTAATPVGPAPAGPTAKPAAAPPKGLPAPAKGLPAPKPAAKPAASSSRPANRSASKTGKVKYG